MITTHVDFGAGWLNRAEAREYMIVRGNLTTQEELYALDVEMDEVWGPPSGISGTYSVDNNATTLTISFLYGRTFIRQ